MKNHDPHIESLLELFMQGETSLEQEQELINFFVNSASIPEEWETFREMFAYFDTGMPIMKEKPKHNIARPVWALLAAAAIATIAIMVAPPFQRTSQKVSITTPQPIIAEKKNKTNTVTVVNTEQPEISPLLAIEKQETKKEKKTVTARQHIALDSIEIEREQGEVEQTQQELMADKFIIEQERQEALNEQYITRAQAYQAQLAAQNENPQLIQVVFK